jgi:hypothetical protein
MARGSSPIAQLAVLGVLGLFAFNWAERQASGSSARATADQVKRALGGVFGSASGPLVSQPGFTAQRQGEQAPAAVPSGHGAEARTGGGVYVTTRLADFGGFPVVFDPGINGMRQDPNQGGTNVYSPGDGFIDPTTGTTWVWQGGTSFADGAGNTASLTDFES